MKRLSASLMAPARNILACCVFLAIPTAVAAATPDQVGTPRGGTPRGGSRFFTGPQPRPGDFAHAYIAGNLDGLPASPEQGEKGGSTGPDVTVIYLGSVNYYGDVAGMHSYSVGTTSCNVGDEPLWWCDDDRAYCDDDQHPVIAHNLYRLKEGRFEQLGMSWLKHGFLSTSSFDSACGNCAPPEHGGDQLGVGCTDTYSAGLSGSRPLGLRSDVDPANGTFPFPYTNVSFSSLIDQRIQVEEAELDPVLNPGARYWIEGQYIAADDADHGNSANNASYREVNVAANFDLNPTGSTVREKPAIYAWPTIDPGVEVIDLDTPGRERFHVARRVTSTGGNTHFEYAIHNLSSDRAAGRFTVALPASTTISNVGFRDVDHHSGEPYAATDWTIEVDGGTVSWFTADFETDPLANALRWGTMFSFWFDADASADAAVQTLGLFKPGTPEELVIPFSSGEIFSDGFENGDILAWE